MPSFPAVDPLPSFLGRCSPPQLPHAAASPPLAATDAISVRGGETCHNNNPPPAAAGGGRRPGRLPGALRPLPGHRAAGEHPRGAQLQERTPSRFTAGRAKGESGREALPPPLSFGSNSRNSPARRSGSGRGERGRAGGGGGGRKGRRRKEGTGREEGRGAGRKGPDLLGGDTERVCMSVEGGFCPLPAEGLEEKPPVPLPRPAAGCLGRRGEKEEDRRVPPQSRYEEKNKRSPPSLCPRRTPGPAPRPGPAPPPRPPPPGHGGSRSASAPSPLFRGDCPPATPPARGGGHGKERGEGSSQLWALPAPLDAPAAAPLAAAPHGVRRGRSVLRGPSGGDSDCSAPAPSPSPPHRLSDGLTARATPPAPALPLARGPQSPPHPLSHWPPHRKY
ncbi:collagen alpha-1(I) chain-like [Pithys albifrons albifrons]|uniref:collagen alpha-1(I) chain-like n=1 Tax=Pithys albifrons albifrons TaxID=3385563 RepID=UPI003A5CDC4F